MYRLLTINRGAIENCRLYVNGRKTHVRFTDITSGGFGAECERNSRLLQPAKYQCMKNGQQVAVYCHMNNCKLRKAVIQSQGFVENVKATTGDSARLQSTSVSSVEDLAKKKKSRKKSNYSKYIELLEVTDTAANERKSSVERLKAKKLQRFIERTQKEVKKKIADHKIKQCSSKLNKLVQPIQYQKFDMDNLDISIIETCNYDDKPMIFFAKDNKVTSNKVLENSEKMEEIIKSFENFRDVIENLVPDPIDNCGCSEMASKPYAERDIYPINSFENALPTDEINASVAKSDRKLDTGKQTTDSRYKSNIHQNKQQERLAREVALRLNLTTYLNVCISVGLQNRALSTLFMYRQRAKRHNATKNLINIDLYNILLHGYAEKGLFDRFRDIFAMIEEDGLKFNEQTFAAIFECLGRLERSPDNTEKIRLYIKQAENMNITVNQIMDKSKFVGDQRDIALHAIQQVHSEFVPIYTIPNLEYNNILLNSLNSRRLENGDTTDNKVDTIEMVNSKLGFKKQQLQEMAKEQLKIELDGFITIKSIDKPKEFSNTEYCREKLNELEIQWRSQICHAISRDINTLRAVVRQKPQGYINCYTYLKTLDPSEYADILIKEIYKLAAGSETFSPTVSQLHKELGLQVQQRYQIKQMKKNGTLQKIDKIYSNYCDILSHVNTSDNARQTWQQLVHEERSSGPSMDIVEVSWPQTILIGVGRFLYGILMRDVKIDSLIMKQNQKSKPKNHLPAFYTLFRNQGRLVMEEVKPHPVLARLQRASRQQTLTFDSNLVPMLCPPQPWSNPHNGGYLLNKSALIRLPQKAIQQWDRIISLPLQNIYPALDSLNQLSSIPWRVNTEILDLIIKIFQNGGDVKLDVPQNSNSLPPLPSIPEKDPTISSEERAKLFKKKMALRRKQAELYSIWCDTLYRLSLANHYRDKVFWLPHNMDFRGRVYPIPPHLNHLGSDLARSILIFDQEQPLGVDGFSWLKLHCINLTGLKKKDSVRERLLYAEEVMPEILDSADNPLNGRQWWAKSDEPWQTLACCMEIAKVHRSSNPEKYLSRFPIHQDGSCNGLQHYAALGRDEAGAISVNLKPSSTPQDVYSRVAALVEKMRIKDASNGLEVAQALQGFVKRKVIKQTVMTNVYGVTRYGARLQIARQLKDIDEFPKEWVWPASNYLTTKTFESLREMFTSTREIQDWLTDCARLISGVCLENVEWVTPLGLPVVQPYNKREHKNRQMSSARVSDYYMVTDMYEKPNVMKQKNAFPPNFIHSLDSSHMMLTSLYCERDGITFVSIHDCFWTHACTVPQLNKICREQFVALHSQPILEDLSQFLQKKYSFKESDFRHDDSLEDRSKRILNRVLTQLPQKGDFDLHNVLRSIYFFS